MENVCETRVCLLHLPLWSSVPNNTPPTPPLKKKKNHFILLILLSFLSNFPNYFPLVMLCMGKVQRTKLSKF